MSYNHFIQIGDIDSLSRLAEIPYVSYHQAIKYNQKQVVLYMLQRQIDPIMYIGDCIRQNNAEMLALGCQQQQILALFTGPTPRLTLEMLIDHIMVRDYVGCLEALFPHLSLDYHDVITSNIGNYFTIDRSYKCIAYLLNRINFRNDRLQDFLTAINARPYVVNFHQTEWRQFFLTNINIVPSNSSLMIKWKAFLLREKEVKEQLETHTIRDLANIIIKYEY